MKFIKPEKEDKPEFDISDKAIRNLTDSEKKAVQDFINSLNRKDDE